MWIGFWVLGLLQLIGYTLYSRLQARFGIIRLIFGTPYRARNIGERFYGTRQLYSTRGVLFWVLITALYLMIHFFVIAKPTAKGHSNFIVLRASDAASPSEFAVLVLALWLPILPTGACV